jgi:hypothetical protein
MLIGESGGTDHVMNITQRSVAMLQSVFAVCFAVQFPKLLPKMSEPSGVTIAKTENPFLR